MRKTARFRRLPVLACVLAASLALPARAARAAEERPLTDYRIVDASSFWVRHQGLWARINLAWVDTTDLNANRPLAYRLELPMNYMELRIEWVRSLRQVETFREASIEAARKILEKGEERVWIERPEAGPPRKAYLQRATLWADVKVDGKDLGTQLIEQGWALPFVPPGVEEPENWRDLQGKLQKAMDGCKGMWQMVLQQCFVDSQKPKGEKK